MSFMKRIPWGYFFLTTALAVVVCIVIYQIAEGLLSLWLPEESALYDFLLFFFGVALVEEGTKYLTITGALSYDGQGGSFTPMAYSIVSGLVFGGMEALIFISNGASLWVRILPVCSHVAYEILMGRTLFQFAADKSGHVKSQARALLLPVFVHGLDDWMLERGQDLIQAENLALAGFCMIGMCALEIAYFLTAFILLKRTIREARELDAQALEQESQTETG